MYYAKNKFCLHYSTVMWGAVSVVLVVRAYQGNSESASIIAQGGWVQRVHEALVHMFFFRPRALRTSRFVLGLDADIQFHFLRSSEFSALAYGFSETVHHLGGRL